MYAVAIGGDPFVLGVPLALSLTVITFLGAYVPLVAATLSGALAVAVTLGAVEALVVRGVVLLAQQVEGDRAAPAHHGPHAAGAPVLILLAFTVDGLLVGVAGVVVAVPSSPSSTGSWTTWPAPAP